MTLPNRGGSNPPLGNFRNTHTDDAENIPPPPHNTHDSTSCKDPQAHYDSRGMTASNEGCMLSRKIKNGENFQRLVAEKDFRRARRFVASEVRLYCPCPYKLNHSTYCKHRAKPFVETNI